MNKTVIKQIKSQIQPLLGDHGKIHSIDYRSTMVTEYSLRFGVIESLNEYIDIKVTTSDNSNLLEKIQSCVLKIAICTDEERVTYHAKAGSHSRPDLRFVEISHDISFQMVTREMLDKKEE